MWAFSDSMGIISLVEEQIAFELTLDNIVFVKTDIEGLQPKILKLFGLGDEKVTITKNACKDLKKTGNSGKQLKHPNFWKLWERLSYLLNLWSLWRFRKIIFFNIEEDLMGLSRL